MYHESCTVHYPYMYTQSEHEVFPWLQTFITRNLELHLS